MGCFGRDDGRLGRGRYFQHDDRQGEAADGAYSDGYEGPSFFKREERQQRHRRRHALHTPLVLRLARQGRSQQLARNLHRDCAAWSLAGQSQGRLAGIASPACFREACVAAYAILRVCHLIPGEVIAPCRDLSCLYNLRRLSPFDTCGTPITSTCMLTPSAVCLMIIEL